VVPASVDGGQALEHLERLVGQVLGKEVGEQGWFNQEGDTAGHERK
jgi:hypothetical protein